MIPRKVRVRDRVYKVKLTKRKLMVEGNEVRGWTLPGEIVINEKLHPDPRELVSTFLHELMHAIENEYELETVPHKAIYDMEGPFADVFADNRSLRACVAKWTRSNYGRRRK